MHLLNASVNYRTISFWVFNQHNNLDGESILQNHRDDIKRIQEQDGMIKWKTLVAKHADLDSEFEDTSMYLHNVTVNSGQFFIFFSVCSCIKISWDGYLRAFFFSLRCSWHVFYVFREPLITNIMWRNLLIQVGSVSYFFSIHSCLIFCWIL